MTDHPLTDEMCDDLSGWPLSEISDDYAEWSKQDMRDAADWQLEQVIEWVSKSGWFLLKPCREHYFISELRKAMRPQQQENN